MSHPLRRDGDAHGGPAGHDEGRHDRFDHDPRGAHQVGGTHDVDRNTGHDADRTVRHDVHRDQGGDVGHGGMAVDRQSVVAREKERYGGVKIGSAFFGWLAATGTAVLLTALVAGAGAAVGLGVLDSAGEAAQQAQGNAETVGIAGAIALLVILFVAYYCGGYVAGRMARFNGLKQGLAVWLWALLIAIVVAIGAGIAGAEFDVLARVNGFPRLPFNEGELTTAGIVTALAVALASLAGALLGGLAGMRFHRKVDKAGLPASVR